MVAPNPIILKVASPESIGGSAVSKVTDALLAARRELATQWMDMPPAEVETHYAGRLGQLQRTISSIGLREAPRSDADRAFIARLHPILAGGDPLQVEAGDLLAAMLLLFPHELPHRYELEAVPAWLRQDYLAYMLAGPLVYREIGEADAYFDHFCRWVDYLRTNLDKKAGDELWRNAGVFFSQHANFLPAYFNSRNVRDLYRGRAAIMEKSLAALGSPLDHRFGPRPHRTRLRVGVLAPHYMPQTETHATLPFYQHLDRTKFEVLLFTLWQSNHSLEQFCARYGERFVPLPPDLRQRLRMLREFDLDFIFFGTNTTLYTNDAAMLAMHRIARIQISGICCAVTSGMRNVDYYLSGRLAEPPDAQAHYSEKLVMLDGPAHCFSFGNESNTLRGENVNRKILGIPADATVFASGANFYKILPEVEDAWMRILAAAPGTYLLLYPFNLNWSNVYPVDAFMLRLREAAARHGVDGGRIMVLHAAPQRGDVLDRLRSCDIYLDSFPYGGATSLLDPLEVGLPIVVLDAGPARSAQGASLLRELEVEEAIARDVDSYVQLAVGLAARVDIRKALGDKIAGGMKAGPRFLDSKWYGAQVGAALDRMWKESGYGR